MHIFFLKIFQLFFNKYSFDLFIKSFIASEDLYELNEINNSKSNKKNAIEYIITFEQNIILILLFFLIKNFV